MILYCNGMSNDVDANLSETRFTNVKVILFVIGTHANIISYVDPAPQKEHKFSVNCQIAHTRPKSYQGQEGDCRACRTHMEGWIERFGLHPATPRLLKEEGR
jgi:hypothetical protein